MTFNKLSDTEKFALKVTLWVFVSASTGLGALLSFNLKASWDNQATQGALIESVKGAENKAVEIKEILKSQIEGANNMREMLFHHDSLIKTLQSSDREQNERIEIVRSKVMRIEAKLN